MIRAVLSNATLALTLALALSACQTMDEQPSVQLAHADLVKADGTPAGSARILATGDEVNITIALRALTPGEHGAHLHMVGSCTAPDFASAGGHLNPGHKQHGSDNPAGAHLGDLPNAVIGANGGGTVSATLMATRAQAIADLFDVDGTAIVIHEKPDDYRTDPSGASGSRIACGVLTQG